MTRKLTPGKLVIASHNKGKLRVLTIAQDIEGAAKVSPYFAENKFAALEPWLDPENNFGFFYETGVLPTTVLYDKELLFGDKTLKAKALINDGKVVRWCWPDLGMDIK